MSTDLDTAVCILEGDWSHQGTAVKPVGTSSAAHADETSTESTAQRSIARKSITQTFDDSSSMAGRAVMSRATPRLALQPVRAAAAFCPASWGNTPSFLLAGGSVTAVASLGVDTACTHTVLTVTAIARLDVSMAHN